MATQPLAQEVIEHPFVQNRIKESIRTQLIDPTLEEEFTNELKAYIHEVVPIVTNNADPDLLWQEIPALTKLRDQKLAYFKEKYPEQVRHWRMDTVLCRTEEDAVRTAKFIAGSK